MTEERRIPVGVLGATGAVGQRLVTLLHDHPWFRIAHLGASERSAGRPYAEAARWIQTHPLPEAVAQVPVRPCEPEAVVGEVPLFFSALDSKVAGRVETAFASAGHLVVTNARNHRMDADVPLVVPEVNPDHLELAGRQEHAPGGIVANPNCSTIGLVLPLRPLHDRFGVESVHVVTLQALSGAGVPGVASLEITDNVVPFISGEEEKLRREPRKILGMLDGAEIRPAGITVSARCTRVPVTDGHTASVSVRLGRPADAEEILDAWAEWRSEPQRLGLPTAPERPVRHLPGPADPQPRLHRDLGRGMTVSVGRLEPDPLFDWSFFALSHNTVRGAAGGAVLCAELAAARGMLPGVDAFAPAEALETREARDGARG